MSVTAARGFRAAGVAAGLKTSGRRDVALVVNDGPRHDAAAVFTSNRIAAAPVLWTRQAAADGRLHAVILNSGGANACTGAPGFQDTHVTAEHVAHLLSTSASDVAVCSTGLIGTRLPMDRLLAGVDSAAASLSDEGGLDAAEAICTTDTVIKQSEYAGAGFTVGGMAKGAGMLAPALATMLVVVTTDAVSTPQALDAALRAACTASFDRIDSDGCMSTNDTVLLLASGASGVTPTDSDLTDAVTAVCLDLAQQLIADAEGASKDVRVEVRGAKTEADALEVGRAVARSNLLKCALHGNDPNWGRVLAAIGTTKAEFDPACIDVRMNGITVCRDSGVGDDRALVDLSGRSVTIEVDLKSGAAEGWILTNDLTADYVHENSAYST